MAKSKTLLELSNAAIPTSFKDSALVLVDYQNEYRNGSLKLFNIEHALSEAAKVLAAARAQNLPVIHVMHDGGAGGLFDLSKPQGQIIDTLKPLTNEAVVKKTKPNSFAGTELEALLKKTGKKNLIVIGLMSHMCLSATIRAAFDLGYDVTTVASTTTTRDLPGAHDDIKASIITDVSLAALKDRFAHVVATPEGLK